MITVLLLMIIYMAFISLGLPDAVFGVAWPLIRTEWVMDLRAGGLIATVTTLGTVASSLLSGRMIAAFGEGKIAFFSSFMTAAALLGFGMAPHYGWILFLAVPLGFGAGSVDTALNHFVSKNFGAHHMNWLHASWGIGATAGPLIMSAVLLQTQSWRAGFRTIAMIQFALAAVLLLSLPLWQKHQSLKEPKKLTARALSSLEVFKTRGAPHAMLVFLFYCAGEYAMGLWGSSYLFQHHGISLERAAQMVALYYGGITAGRLLAGVISFRLNNWQMMKLGFTLSVIGALLLISNFYPLPAFMFIGLGFAPIFPAMVHETPRRFGEQASQTLIGYQFAAAYVGIATVPPLIGIALSQWGIRLFPFFMLVLVLLQWKLASAIKPYAVSDTDY
ncbi:MAG: MFS transporter [Bacillota bacterium]|nr:MFS transporter [Bacillota bacterium]MDW7678612.1 MFS transporter [Bacillota bacterium]